MKSILILSSVFALINLNSAWGSFSDGDRKGGDETHKPFKTSSNPNIIVRDVETIVKNPVYGEKIPSSKRKPLPEAGSSSTIGNDSGSDEKDTRENQSPPHVPLLRLKQKKSLSFEEMERKARNNVNDREDRQGSFRRDQYKGLLGETKKSKSFADRQRDKKELKTITPDPKNPRFQELFLDSNEEHGLKLRNINIRRELVRGDEGTGGGVSDGGEDFSSYVIILQGFFGTIEREEYELKKLEEALAVSKTEKVELLRRGVESDIEKEKSNLMANQAVKISLSRSVNALKLLGVRKEVPKGAKTGLKSAQSSLEEAETRIAKAKEKIEALQESLQAIRTPEDIELEIKRTTKRLKFFIAEEERTIKRLGLATGISLSKLKKLPPIAPERRTPANAYWD
tara:strand:+ start:5956 stop:7149 length:1194 start_codon:yes stop_codon:yes gene_type:complete